MFLLLAVMVSALSLSAHAATCVDTIDADVRLWQDYKQLADFCKDPSLVTDGAKIAVKLRAATVLMRNECERTCADHVVLEHCGAQTPNVCGAAGLPAAKLVYKGGSGSDPHNPSTSPGPNDNGTCYNDHSCAEQISENVSLSQCSGGSWKDQWTLQCYSTGR